MNGALFYIILIIKSNTYDIFVQYVIDTISIVYQSQSIVAPNCDNLNDQHPLQVGLIKTLRFH